MTKKKAIRTRGKLQLSRFFQKLNVGDYVAISREQAVPASFDKRLQGDTGIVEGKRGRFYVVKIRDHNQYKTLVVEPIHLKKIKQTKDHD